MARLDVEALCAVRPPEGGASFETAALDGLDQELIRRIFQIDPAERRKCASVFASWIDPASIMNDDLFYAALARRISAGDLEPLRRYEALQADRNRRRKRFSMRITRHLNLFRIGVGAPGAGGLKLPVCAGEAFDPAVLYERAKADIEKNATHRLLWKVFPSLLEPVEAEPEKEGPEPDPQESLPQEPEAMREEEPEEEVEVAEGWTGLAGNLRSSLERLTWPDPVAAREILALAQELLDACEDDARRGLQMRREALGERLAGSGLAFVPILAGMGEEGISGLEALVSAFGEAREGCEAAAAETARIKHLLDLANDQDDFDEIERLSALRRGSAGELAAAEGARDALRAQILAVFGETEADIVSEAGPETGLDVASRHEEEPPEEELPERGAPVDLAAPPPDSGPASGEIEASGPEAGEAPETAPPALPETIAEIAEIIAEAPPEAAAEAAEEEAPEVFEALAEPPALLPEAAAPEPPDATAEEAPQESDGPALLPEDPPAAPLSTEEALALRLSRGETALAWHLARLIGRTGETPPVPPSVLEALVLAPTVQDAEYAPDTHERSVSLEEALQEAPAAPAPEASATLLMAALLRPAFFTPDFDARRRLADLPHLGDAALCLNLAGALSGLEHRFRLSTEDLAELAGLDRARRLPAANRTLRDWLAAARRRHHVHSASRQILYGELDPLGDLGGAMEAALAGRPDAEALVEAAMGRIATRQDREELVFAREQRLGRPARDRIDGHALAWITDHLAEAAALLAAWLEASRFDQGASRSDRAQLANGVRQVRRAAEAARAVLRDAPPHDDPLQRAARRRLLAAIEDLLTLISGGGVWKAAPTRAALFEEPLLRLPGGCQDWTGAESAMEPAMEPAMEEERRARDERLWEALHLRDALAPDDRAAFERHRRNAAILPARALLARMRTADPEQAAALALLEDQLNGEDLPGARRKAKDRVLRLRQDLTSLAHLDVGLLRAQEGALARLEAVFAALSRSPEEGEVSLPALNRLRAAEVPPDFPELDEALRSLEAGRDLLRAHVRRVQSEALEALRADPRKAASAEALLAAVERLDPTHLDAAIADLRGGRESFPPEADPPDGFSRFFPEFVEQVSRRPAPLPVVSDAIRDGAAVGPLDFSRLSPEAGRRAQALHKGWLDAAKAFRVTDPRRLGEALKGFLQDFGADSVRIESEKDEIPGKLRVFRLTCAPWRSEGCFVPPIYGSLAQGRYALAAVSGEAAFEEVERRLSRLGRSRPTLALVFGPLDVHRRRRLARLLRREGSWTLLLDETMLNHILMEGAAPLDSFLTAAAPFSGLRPYETGPGRISPEVFVGREEEMRRVAACEGGGWLVHGGRRMGKSALLDRIGGEHHRPDEGKIAFALEIAQIGRAGSPASDIWTILANRLRQERAFARVEGDPDEILGAVSAWLAEAPERRLLAMFDEADSFLKADQADGHPNLTRLRRAAQDGAWRFKTVFAGPGDLRRLARTAEAPLPAPEEAVFVGPMNRRPEDRAALRRLAVAPMRAAGFEYESPELVDALLARANHVPALVQVFCREAIEGAGSRPEDLSGEGPRWRLGRSALFEGEAAERIEQEIRSGFQMTLNLDPRHDLIARSLARRRLESPETDRAVMENGLTLGEIGEMIAEWRPASWPAPSEEELGELLAEMAGLGVLTDHGSGRFSLLNARIAQMLGGLDQLDDDILALSQREEPPEHDAALLHRSLAPEAPGERAPLSDRRLEELLDHGKPGLRIVEGFAAVAGEGLGRRLCAAAAQWRTYLKIRRFEKQQDDRPPGKDVLAWINGLGRTQQGLLVLDRPWDQKLAAALSRREEVEEGRLLPIWVRPDPAEAVQEPATVFRAGVWSEAMLRLWLLEEGLFVYDEPELRRALVSATGLAPRRIFGIRPVLARSLALGAARRRSAVEAWTADHPLTAEEAGVGAEFAAALDLLLLADEGSPADRAEIDAGNTGASGAFERLELAFSDGKGGLSPTPLGRLIGRSLS
ncbi:hypothetical protein [Neomegalonema sp.]|uniref:hypothetical protein n=1 Tax=Neomegalonema sp. TaxID=2039713 RepID=UPI00260FCBE2|nr:hypothetical protein [Neomegalonema sp.]MDD2867363.1 hypothetical protein [Neomegalonema sp.]